MKRTFTVCPYCGTGCMLHLLSEGGRLVGVEPVKNHPVSRGGSVSRGGTPLPLSIIRSA